MTKAIFLRGPSGSGKSTWAKANHPSALVCSADHFFVDSKTGEYKWDATKLGQAHGACQAKFAKALKEKLPVVIVDNTMIKPRDMEWYYKTASELGYEIEVVEFRKPLKSILGRNSHGVPDESVKRMHDMMQQNPLPSHWKFKLTQVTKD
jgi:predicted kinase